MKKSPIDLRLYFVCAVLFFGTLILFSRAVPHDFLDLDDPDYVTQNNHVHTGLTWAGIRWAFTSTDAGNWHPLTWLSHTLDWQFFGNNPRGHHATNVFLHALNAMLAFLALRKLTSAFWLSAASAALFAWHPLRVESVAWIAERKDVLSGFFFFLTLLAYTHYVEKQKARNPKFKIFYGLTILFFAFGLMSKPMLVTVPFLLLLLDFWPLQRFNYLTIKRLLIEKIPFFLMSATVCIITYHAQKSGGAIVENLSFGVRLENAAVSIAGYLGKFFWPFNLAVAYPLPDHPPIATVAASTFLLVTITAAAIWQWHLRPWLFTGWFWFLGMLVPVIGLVQAGDQAMADRYTYLPVLGLQFALLWTFHELALSMKIERSASVIAAVVLIACATRTWNQEAVWKNSQTLYEHALAVTENNYLAESNLGTTLFNEQNFPGAEQHFHRAIAINPHFATARFKLAVVFEESGHADEALAAYMELLKIQPDNAVAQYNAGVILLNRNEPSEAIPHFQAAVETRSDYVEAFVGLGMAESQIGQTAEAIDNFQKALRLNPNFPGVAETLVELRRKLALEKSDDKK